MVLKIFVFISVFFINSYALKFEPSTLDLRSLTFLVSQELNKNILISSDLKNLEVDVYCPEDLNGSVLFNFYKKAISSKNLFLNDYKGFYVVEKLKKVSPVKVIDKNIKLEISVIEFDNEKFKELGFKSSADVSLRSIFKAGNLFGSTTIFKSGALFDLQSNLKMLEEKDIIHVVSNPVVIVKNRQTSTMMIGDTVSILTSSLSDDTSNTKVRNTYVQQDIGLQITAKPVIRDNGKIDIYVNLNMQNLKDYSEGLATTTKRSINSNFTLNDKDTIKIGGLVQEYKKNKIYKLPILGDIPLLKYLFSYSSQKQIRNTLSILIKVTLL